MAPRSPSIQSFFSSSPSKASANASSSTSSIPPPPQRCPISTGSLVGDGFTSEELDTVLHPPSAQWAPTQDYEEADIGALEPGPQYVTFTGRVVNLYNMPKSSKKPMAAKGCLKLMVADDTGALTVRLWYAHIEYKIRLGQIVTVWTVHISQGEQASLAPTAAPLFTSIFPERERSCHIKFCDDAEDGTLYKRPYGCEETEVLPGLMTLKNFTDGGHGVEDCKLLVCVKSIGARKRFTNKNGHPTETVSVGVFDDTGEAVLDLWGATCISASHWQPSHTVLLISDPGWRLDRTTKLSLSGNTRIDIDPHISDALWLRALAQRLTKREHVNPPFPDGVFDIDAAETAAVRILYNLADIDDFARKNPKERFIGYISVLITELNFVINYKRNMLMSTECCGVPIYANALTVKCRQCQKEVPLRINPKIIGPVIDETGQIATGKLVFSDAAWQQLLGRTAEQLVSDDLETLKFMEQRMLFLRVSLGFGWCLAGSVPMDEQEEISLKPWERKRKRLDVFKQKENIMENGTENGTNRKDPAKDFRVEEAKEATSSGVGEVGRLCIWCVKM